MIVDGAPRIGGATNVLKSMDDVNDVVKCIPEY